MGKRINWKVCYENAQTGHQHDITQENSSVLKGDRSNMPRSVENSVSKLLRTIRVFHRRAFFSDRINYQNTTNVAVVLLLCYCSVCGNTKGYFVTLFTTSYYFSILRSCSDGQICNNYVTFNSYNKQGGTSAAAVNTSWMSRHINDVTRPGHVVIIINWAVADDLRVSTLLVTKNSCRTFQDPRRIFLDPS